MEALKLNGMRVKITDVGFLDGNPENRLLAVSLEADDSQLARLHPMRPFDLHLSIAYEWQMNDDDLLLVEALRARWVGRDHVFWVQWIGVGATAQLHPRDRLLQDPNFVKLFRLNHPHISM